MFGSVREVRSRSEEAGRIWARAGLPTLALHDCRHTFASLMTAAAGVNAKAPSGFMGHATIEITLGLYAT